METMLSCHSWPSVNQTEINSILISKVRNKPSSNIYFENLHDDYNSDWAAIYMLPHFVTYNTSCDLFNTKS